MELYKTLVRPNFDYGDVVTLQRLQNMANKNILRVPKRSPTATIHAMVKLELLKHRRWCHVAREMYK